MMMMGGALWALDISNIDDARKKLRGGLGLDGSNQREKEAEEEFEEWLASTLARKETKERVKEQLDRAERREKKSESTK